MTNIPLFEIIPMTAPDGSTDYLPCEEEYATHWWIRNRETDQGLILDDRVAATRYLDQRNAEAQRSRASRFVWNPDDVEHHE